MTIADKAAHDESPDAKTILLHPGDTVLVSIAPIASGDRLAIDGLSIIAPGPVDVGHKLARQALSPGDKVIKYGAPIGSVTRAVAAGAHVHTHNMKSDYIPSHSRQSCEGNRNHD